MAVYVEFHIDYEHPNGEGDYLIVEYIGYPRLENDGIGGYEFWGFTGYDEGRNYYACEEIHWDKELYNDYQNRIIKDYLEENFEEVEKKIIKNIKNN